MVTQVDGFTNMAVCVIFSCSMYIQMNLARVSSNNASDLSRVFLGQQALQDCLVFRESQHPIQM